MVIATILPPTRRKARKIVAPAEILTKKEKALVTKAIIVMQLFIILHCIVYSCVLALN